MTHIPAPIPTDRAALIARLAEGRRYDIAVVGGGATGLGVALDAAARGLSVVLLEATDFAKGSSSRATKLVHGGVRYLAQGNVALVREALRERSTLLANAPHLAQPVAFVMPAYRFWELPFYGIGLKLYDALAGKAGLGSTELMGRARTLERIPGVRAEGLMGGVQYWDGQFDDARLAVALARTAASQGALLVNHCPVERLLYENGKVSGLTCRDAEGGGSYTIQAGCVVNATGVWVDALRAQDSAAAGQTAEPLVSPSQGVHLVVDAEFMPGRNALLVPRTSDGRVLFAVPWLGKVILGTTDTPRPDAVAEPRPFQEEIDFILTESARYLRRAPTAADVRSTWVGLRPLVRPQASHGSAEATKKISREHTVLSGAGGLVTVTGGKWTTYRAMAEDVLRHCEGEGLIPARPEGATLDLPLVGAPAPGGQKVPIAQAPGAHLYGSEAALLAGLPGADVWLAPGLSEAMVRFAARYEYARSVEDVLARRSRLLFLDAAAAAAVAPRVAQLLAEEGAPRPDADAFAILSRQFNATSQTAA
ncbi:FAD-dependent oxidoreductase [Xylophilus rhododendri]|uniref:FAD-dependent oxidoreductase n=1 Tax=Xylophilus rhododendri TaxID=2697032 RepID=A0A857J821_9BURK|nr:glycerol-3-phosphate dehydrogenase/oxidase [Xylophilus rhododendri]QHI99209.1 FAD-dependent oxidoreductase [Xylophilus rhododendri]